MTLNYMKPADNSTMSKWVTKGEESVRKELLLPSDV